MRLQVTQDTLALTQALLLSAGEQQSRQNTAGSHRPITAEEGDDQANGDLHLTALQASAEALYQSVQAETCELLESSDWDFSASQQRPITAATEEDEPARMQRFSSTGAF